MWGRAEFDARAVDFQVVSNADTLPSPESGLSGAQGFQRDTAGIASACPES